MFVCATLAALLGAIRAEDKLGGQDILQIKLVLPKGDTYVRGTTDPVAGLVADLTLTNTSGAAITGAVSLTLDSLSANATLFGKSGVTSATTPSGSPYLDVQTGDLAAGASVTATLEFTNSDNTKGITYAARVLAGPGSR